MIMVLVVIVVFMIMVMLVVTIMVMLVFMIMVMLVVTIMVTLVVTKMVMVMSVTAILGTSYGPSAVVHALSAKASPDTTQGRWARVRGGPVGLPDPKAQGWWYPAWM